MLRQKQSILAWQVADDEEMWRQLTAADDGPARAGGLDDESQRPKILGRALLGAVTVAFVLMSVLGSYLYRQAAAGLAQVTSELETTVETEKWAAANGSRPVLQEVLDPAAPVDWRSRMLRELGQPEGDDAGGFPLAAVRPLQFQDGVALVLVQEQWAAGRVYVVHRFYRETDAGWVRTTPRPTLWGPQRYHETRFFRFHFRRRDARAVQAVAAEIDAFYSGLHAELGLPAPHGAERLSIHVTLPESPELAMLRVQLVGERLDVPSPDLVPVLESATPGEALEQTIRQALIHHLFQVRQKLQATEMPRGRPYLWYLLNEGIRTWYLQQTSYRAAGYTESVRWLYTAWPAIRRGDRSLDAAAAERLCHLATGGPPVLGNRLLPSECSAARQAELRQKLPAPPQNLNDLELAPAIYAPQEHWMREWQRRAVLASAVGYGVDEYGRENVSRLLQAMSEHDDWETLIPAVYGVSAEEFQEGWLAYLTS